MEQIIWIPVPGYEGFYEIDVKGNIRSLSKKSAHKIISSRIGRDGYATVRLSKHSIVTTHYLHRLLALSFIPNVKDDKYVNHIDGNKLNNSIANLEWCSHSENVKHAYSIGLIKKKHRPLIDKCSGSIYKSLSEAASALNLNYYTLRNYLNGSSKNPTCLDYLVAV